ncbi:MAG: twin-arginine translocase subunit TatC [Candidatus Fermentibacterota bacterium]
MKVITEGSFWDHLEELRWRILKSLAALIAATLGAFFFSRRLMALVLATGPETLQALAPTEAFVVHLKAALVAGVVIASPVVYYQFWRFVSPGLHGRERRPVIAATALSVLLFVGGVAFAWALMLRPAIALFRSFEGGRVVGAWSLSSYVGFLGRFVLAFGLAFQLPIVVLLLASLGIVSPQTMGRYRRHLIVGLLVAAALLTPPDPMTQLALSAPLYLLFELSLLLARVTCRRRRAAGA